MKIKVGTQIFDSSNVPVMLTLTDEEKNLISSMDPQDKNFCSYPEYMESQDAELWMKEVGIDVRSIWGDCISARIAKLTPLLDYEWDTSGYWEEIRGLLIFAIRNRIHVDIRCTSLYLYVNQEMFDELEKMISSEEFATIRKWIEETNSVEKTMGNLS